jgi:NAD(P)-dependent dehydrogenase (short-subunit alcohol dehydrogenase family)
MNISFENKVALVTGAASGLGLATAKAFAEAGAAVALADWNEKEVKAAAKELADKGHKTLAIRCDVSDDAQVEAMVKQTVATFGRSTQPTTMLVFKMFSPKRLIHPARTTTGSWRSTCAAYGVA